MLTTLGLGVNQATTLWAVEFRGAFVEHGAQLATPVFCASSPASASHEHPTVACPPPSRSSFASIAAVFDSLPYPSAKLDFPDPLRPTTMVRPGPPPPSFDGEGGEVCAGVGGCRGLLVGLRRRLGVLEDAVKGVAAVADGKDEAAPVLVEEILGFEASPHQLSEVTVHEGSGNYGHSEALCMPNTLSVPPLLSRSSRAPVAVVSLIRFGGRFNYAA